MDIQKAIQFWKGCKANGTDFAAARNAALKALQEQAEREKGCEYCCGEIEVDTPFCPYCGKRLK